MSEIRGPRADPPGANRAPCERSHRGTSPHEFFLRIGALRVRPPWALPGTREFPGRAPPERFLNLPPRNCGQFWNLAYRHSFGSFPKMRARRTMRHHCMRWRPSTASRAAIACTSAACSRALARRLLREMPKSSHGRTAGLRGPMPCRAPFASAGSAASPARGVRPESSGFAS